LSRNECWIVRIYSFAFILLVMRAAQQPLDKDDDETFDNLPIIGLVSSVSVSNQTKVTPPTTTLASNSPFPTMSRERSPYFSQHMATSITSTDTMLMPLDRPISESLETTIMPVVDHSHYSNSVVRPAVSASFAAKPSTLQQIASNMQPESSLNVPCDIAMLDHSSDRMPVFRARENL
jgi:hypothetical protein